jgi:hypothetical protein
MVGIAAWRESVFFCYDRFPVAVYYCMYVSLMFLLQCAMDSVKGRISVHGNLFLAEKCWVALLMSPC